MPEFAATASLMIREIWAKITFFQARSIYSILVFIRSRRVVHAEAEPPSARVMMDAGLMASGSKELRAFFQPLLDADEENRVSNAP